MLRMNPWIRSIAALCAFASLAASCANSTVVNEPEPPAEESPADMPAATPEGASDPASAATDPSKEPGKTGEPEKTGAGDTKAPAAAKGAKADGDACDKADDCSSGVCEGEGCGPGQGKCAPKERQCTLDLRPYCGCDGKTFQSGGTCPRARYSKKGACDGDPAGAPKTLKKPG